MRRFRVRVELDEHGWSMRLGEDPDTAETIAVDGLDAVETVARAHLASRYGLPAGTLDIAWELVVCGRPAQFAQGQMIRLMPLQPQPPTASDPDDPSSYGAT